MLENEHNEIPEESIKDGAIIDCLKVKADPPDITPDERKRNVKKLAGAISHSLRARGEINIRCFGSASIGKAVKAISIAKDYVSVQKIKLECSVGFITAKMGENELTGICFIAFASELPENEPVVDLEKGENVLLVKADSKEISAEDRKKNLHSLAGAISHALEDNKQVVIRAFGNSCQGKCAKALAVARTYVAGRGFDLYFYPRFIVTNMNGNERTGIAWVVQTNEG